MIFRTVTVTPKHGKFTIALKEPCKCRIALFDIILPCINQRDKPNNAIQIQCEQIDQTFHNPDRLLKRIYFDRLAVTNSSHFWEAKILEFQEINSSERFLEFTIQRLSGFPVKFHRNTTDHRVFLTFAIELLDDDEDEFNNDKWACL